MTIWHIKTNKQTPKKHCKNLQWVPFISVPFTGFVEEGGGKEEEEEEKEEGKGERRGVGRRGRGNARGGEGAPY